MDRVASQNAQILLKDLLDLISEETAHERLLFIDETARHAAMYEGHHSVRQLADVAGQEVGAFIDELTAWMHEHFVLPGDGGPVLLALPGTLYVIRDVETQARGLAVQRHMTCLQGLDQRGAIWTRDFNPEKTIVAIISSRVAGPSVGEGWAKAAAAPPLLMRIEPVDELYLLLDPQDDEHRRRPQMAQAVLDMGDHARSALLILGHLQRSGSLEDHRVVAPLRDAH